MRYHPQKFVLVDIGVCALFGAMAGPLLTKGLGWGRPIAAALVSAVFAYGCLWCWRRVTDPPAWPEAFALDRSVRDGLVDRLRATGLTVETVSDGGDTAWLQCGASGNTVTLGVGPGYADLPDGFIVTFTPAHGFFDRRARAFFRRLRAFFVANGGRPYDLTITLDQLGAGGTGKGTDQTSIPRATPARRRPPAAL